MILAFVGNVVVIGKQIDEVEADVTIIKSTGIRAERHGFPAEDVCELPLVKVKCWRKGYAFSRFVCLKADTL